MCCTVLITSYAIWISNIFSGWWWSDISDRFLFTCNDSPTWKVRARISVVPPRGIPLSVIYIPFGNPNASFWEWSSSTKKLYGWLVRWVVGCCRLFACLVACRLRDWLEDTVMWVYRLSDIRIARMRPRRVLSIRITNKMYSRGVMKYRIQ